MKTHLRVIALSLTASTIVIAQPALAQSASANAVGDQFKAGGDSVTLGVGGAVVPDYEGSNNYRLAPAPLALGSYHGFAFSVIGNRASIDLIPNRADQTIDIQAGPIGVINFNRSSRSGIDDARVKALPEQSTALELGGYIGIGKTGIITSPYDKLSVSVSYRHSVTGPNGGGIWQPSINYLTPLSTKAAVILFASMQHVERGYARAYFDVTPTDSAASGLPVFYGSSGWKNYSLGAAATYSLTGNLLHGLKAVGGVGYTRLLNSYSYSPVTRIAGSPDQWLGGLGLAYTF